MIPERAQGRYPIDEEGLALHRASPFFQAEIREMIVHAKLRPGMTALDIGCGNGALVAAAAEVSAATGMDISIEVVEAARKLTGLPSFLLGSSYCLPVRDGSLDRLFTQHLIEHLKDPARALADWRRVLRPGGRLIVLTPNALYPDPALFEDPTHVQIFDAHSLRQVLSASGFRILKSRTILPYLRGHTVFGLRHAGLFARLPPWSWSGRSLLIIGEAP